MGGRGTRRRWAYVSVLLVPPCLALLWLAGSGCKNAAVDGRTRPTAASFEAERGRDFEQPRELRSRDGRLSATFTVERTPFEVAGARVWGMSYQRTFIGPTLRVTPGDVIHIHLVNRLGEPTNLHEHGFHVSPLGTSDNVLRTIPDGRPSEVRVRIPEDIAPGTYWYHSHLHGLSEEQVFSGLAGVIVVDGLTERLPRTLRHVPERVIALKDAQIRAGAIVDRHIDSSAPTTRTVNGLVDPVLRVRTNQTQLLRLANISADIWYRLRVDGARLSVLAEDANPVGRVWTADELLLPPGKRYDVLARWPSAGTFSLRTLRFSSGPAGDTYPDRRLATVRVAGAPFAEESWPRAMGPMPHLQRKHVSRVRRLTFSEDAATGRFFINGRQFDASRVDEVAQLGTTEEWIVRNVTGEEHPFHIHTNDFQVMSINGKPYEARGLQDTVPLPVHGEVRLRMRFADFLGPSVYHCHILAHEDGGMMGVLDVTRSGRRPSARTLRGLRAMRMAMTMPASHHH